ncbi:MAG: zf-HC2 domain-containing protein [Phycisphaeraceae bacterium]|nr:zf-HC2 domain-containing protein [Phycisphaeraceae bacterium]
MAGGVPREFGDLVARLEAGGSLNCRDCSEFLMAYLDNEMGQEIRARFETHLSNCCSCRNYVDTYRQTVKLAQEACCPKANPQLGKCPPELVAAILASLGRPQQERQ